MANEIITDAGIITVGGSTNTVVIGGATYTGDAYSQDQIRQAISQKQIVAAQDVTLGRFDLGSNKSFVGDTITVSGNTAQLGGAISVSTGAVTMENSTFSGNTASVNGGAVFLSGSSTATVENCTFSCNTTTNGGAFCLSRSTATVENCTFSCNTATINGGAIWNEPDSTLTIRDSIFATATDSIFNGGALTLGGTITTAAQISSTEAIVVETGTKLVLDLSVYSEANNAAFLSNYDYVFFGQEDNFDIAVKVNAEQTEGDYILASEVYSFSFSKSITLTCGGETSAALALGNSIIFKEHIYSLALSSSYALVLTVSNGIPAGIVTENGDKEKLSIGGNIYAGAAYTPDQISQAISEKQTVAAQDVTLGRFELRTDKSFVGDGITMSGNTELHGGAISVSTSAVTMENSTFSGNTATLGGAICGFTGAVTMENSTFSGNTATLNGGAIYGLTGAVTMENSTFSGNTAINGGAIHVDQNTTVTVENSTFSDNTATNRGGAIYLDTSTATVENSTFSCNTATNRGGAIYNESASTLTIRDSIFATATDSIYNSGALTLGGTITTAAQISSDNAIVFETGTKLVLDLSGYDEGSPTAFLSNYDMAFGNDADFSITVNVAEKQAKADYILADTAANFDKSVTITCGENSGELTLKKTIELNDLQYTLALDAEDRLVLTIATPLLAIVTAGGTTTSVTIGDTTYTGTAKKTEDIAKIAGSFKQIVMQGGRVQNLEDSPVNLDNEQELIADTVVFYSNNNADGDGGALNNSGELTVTSFSGLAHGVRASFTDNHSSHNGGAVNNNGVFSATDVLFDGNRANLNGGALYNSSGTATITGATFTGNSAASGGAVYNLNANLTLSDSVFSGNTSSGFDGALSSNNTSQSLTLENCRFLTRTDTVFANGGTITLGGVIVTAAELNFGGAITIKPDTKILLDLSSYSGTELTSGLLANYDDSFAPQQDNLTISVNAASLTQKQGNYVIASQVGELGFKESISVYATGSDESLFSVALGGTTLYNGRTYSLANSGSNIVLSIAGNIDTLYVNSGWAGLADGEPVVIPGGITAHIGVDAFDSFAFAKTMYPEKIKFAGGSYGDVIFGGSESENVKDVEANTNLTLLAGTFSKSVFAGNKIKTEEMLQTLSLESSLDIQDGSYAAYVMGGDYLSTEHPNVALVNTTGSRSMNISGGEFSGLVAGGSFIAGGTATLVSQLDGDIDVTIAGGTFNNRIYGGDITDKMANSTTDIINGNIHFTIDASVNDISINESIVCGSYGYGTVKGDVVFTVKGTAAKLTFADTSVVNGGSGSGYLKAANGKTVKEYDNFVNGTSTAVFEGFSGDFDARLTLFDAISFSNGADVSLTNAKCNLAELSAWQFANGASVAFCDGQINDFTGDTLNIDLTGWETADEWTLATGSSDAAFSGFEAFEAVKFDGTAAKYEAGVWKAGEFALSLSEDKKSMVLAQVC